MISILNLKYRYALFLFSQVTHMLKVRQPYFSNLIEQDSGVVTAGMIDTRHSSNISEEDAKTDLYKPVFKFEDVKELMSKGVEEYNKIHPRIKLALYKVGRFTFFLYIEFNQLPLMWYIFRMIWIFLKTLFQYYGNIMNEISAAEENRSMLSMIFFAWLPAS